MKYPDVNSWDADRYAEQCGDDAELEALREEWDEVEGLDVLETLLKEEDGMEELMENEDFLQRIVEFCMKDSSMMQYLKNISFYEHILDTEFEKYLSGLKDSY